MSHIALKTKTIIFTIIYNFKMKLKLLYVLLLVSYVSKAQNLSQNRAFVSQDLVINEHVEGTLLVPTEHKTSTLVIMIGDYGPTDRNGNQNFSKHYLLKKLAEQLTKQGLSTFRYDKRIVKQVKKNNIDSKLTFDDFIIDAITTIRYFKTKNKYDSIFIVGHGQGSLVGSIAAKEGINGLISIAGTGNPIDKVIAEQVAQASPGLLKDTERLIDLLKKGKTTNDYPPALSSIFNKDIQAFMASWMQYNPQKELKDLNLPTLIINGTKDLEVPLKETKLLQAAALNAKTVIIDNMNHVLFIIEGGNLENSKSYNESFREISPKLVIEVVSFIKTNKG